jgi:hypothetical protein
MEEQNYVGKIGIRTPCYITIKEQNHISHMGNRTHSLVFVVTEMSTYTIAKR